MDKERQMSYFPFFIDLEGKEGLVIGGGSVALRKVEAAPLWAETDSHCP